MDRIFQSGNALGLVNVLQQMRGKDDDAASKLADDLMKRIRSGNLAEDGGLATFATNLLQSAMQSTTQKSGSSTDSGSASTALLDDSTMRDLADRLAAAFLARNVATDGVDRAGPYYSLEQTVLPAIEKYAPNRAQAVRDRVAETAKLLDPGAQVFAELADQDDPSADAILKIAGKAPDGMKDSLYTQAIQKTISDGDFDRAQQLISDHVSDDNQRGAFLDSIERQRIVTAIEKGKVEEARQMLDQLGTPEERVTLLTQLASQVAAKGNKSGALQLLADARGQMGGPPETETEFEATLQIAAAYAAADPAQGFDVLEGTLDGVIRIIDASAVLDGFQGHQQFKDGEMLIHANGLTSALIQRWSQVLSALARGDVDRARIAAERFGRPEVKAVLHLAVAGGVLSKGTPGLKSNPNMYPVQINGSMVYTRAATIVDQN
jgi:hypothetical protein